METTNTEEKRLDLSKPIKLTYRILDKTVEPEIKENMLALRVQGLWVDISKEFSMAIQIPFETGTEEDTINHITKTLGDLTFVPNLNKEGYQDEANAANESLGGAVIAMVDAMLSYPARGELKYEDDDFLFAFKLEDMEW